MRSLAAAAPYLVASVVLALAGCYRGPGTEDARETSATGGIVPWRIALLPGKTSETSGIGYVTHRRECCGIGVRSEFVVPNVRGAHALYFDFAVPVTGRGVTIAFDDGRKVTTGGMTSGPETVRAELSSAEIDSNGATHIVLSVTATPPDHVAAIDGPTVMAFYGVAADRDVNGASDTLKTVVEAK